MGEQRSKQWEQLENSSIWERIIKVNVERSGQSPDISLTQSSKDLLVKDVKYEREKEDKWWLRSFWLKQWERSH